MKYISQIYIYIFIFIKGKYILTQKDEQNNTCIDFLMSV